jgi:hypothetical protein
LLGVGSLMFLRKRTVTGRWSVGWVLVWSLGEWWREKMFSVIECGRWGTKQIGVKTALSAGEKEP